MGIYVVTHKPMKMLLPKGYSSIVVNANKIEAKGDFYDNKGKNISNKNPSYNELTAMYWIWKNKNDPFIGITHYRRFFEDNGEFLTIEKVNEILNDKTIILPEKRFFRKTVANYYVSTSGYKIDLKVLRNVIEQKYPEYLTSYDEVMQEKSMYCYNMAIMTNKQYNDYCEWLFNILFEVEKKLDILKKGHEDRKGYFRRIYGFMSERLLNVYIKKRAFNIKEYPIRFLGTTPELTERVKTKLIKIKDKYL